MVISLRIRLFGEKYRPIGRHAWNLAEWLATLAGMTIVQPRRLGLAALLVAEAMNLLDSTIVQVVAPTMHADLGGPASDLQWFSAAYTLPFAVLLITGGRLGDLAGRRRAFRIGVTVFLLTSLACALAPTAGAVIAFRVAQGAAAAVIIPQTIGLIKAMFTGPVLASALSTIGPVMGAAAVCGPILGALLTHAGSWRAAFLVNVPLSILVLALTPTIPEDRAPHRVRLDPVGTLLAILAAFLIVYPLLTPPISWTPITLGVLVAVLLGLQQRRGGLVEVSLFRTPRFPAALISCTLFFAATTGLSLVVILHLQLDQGADVLSAALTLLPWSIGLAVGSRVGTFLLPRWGRWSLLAGLVLLLLGVLALILGLPLLVALAAVGIGHGVFATGFFTRALAPVGPQETGSAAGLLNAVQQLGGTLGVAVLGSVYLAHSTVPAYWIVVGLVGVTGLLAAV
jgi:MFS family permease